MARQHYLMNIKRYIRRLKTLVEFERRAEIEAMKKEIALLSGKEREERRRAILGLRGYPQGKEFGYLLVRFSRERPIDTEIGVGDLVVISRGQPLKSRFFGVVTEKGKRYIVVAVDNLPSWALRMVRIDLFANEITFKRMIATLDNLTDKGVRVLRFALGQKEPKEPKSVSFEKIDNKLNKIQEKAVGLALGTRDFLLIHGPFGTGKSRTLAEIALQFARQGKKVLATAETNVALDNLVARLFGRARIVRLGHPSRISNDLIKASLFWQVENFHRYRIVKNFRNIIDKLIGKRNEFQKPIPSLKRGLSDKKILALARRGQTKRGVGYQTIRSMAEWIKIQTEIKEMIKESKAIEEEIGQEIISLSEIILATNSSAALEFIEGVEFDVAVVDEATQATIPSILIPLNKAKRFILAGDHRQLPPTVLSEKARELSLSLFERLITNFPQNSILLNIQYRMAEKLMDFPNREFYQGKLKTDDSVKKIGLDDLVIKKKKFGNLWDDILASEKPICFLDTSSSERKGEVQRPGSFSKENPFEAKLVREVLDKLLEIGIKKEDLGVITPYKNQAQALRKVLEEGIEVDTVDGYQGREKEVIVISFVRSSKEKELGFLTDLRRLNTALTRAKRKLICIGDKKTLAAHPVYARLLDFIKKEGGLFSIDEV